MPASDYQMLLDFFSRHPFGPDRDNIHAAMQCAILTNIHRKKGTQPVKPKEFMIRDPEVVKQENLQALLGSFRQKGKPKNG